MCAVFQLALQKTVQDKLSGKLQWVVVKRLRIRLREIEFRTPYRWIAVQRFGWTLCRGWIGGDFTGTWLSV